MKKILVIFVCLAIVSGCIKKQEDREYLARVNDEKLIYSEFRKSFTDEEWNMMSRDDKEDLLTEWVNLTALAQRCDQEGLSEIPKVKTRMEMAEKKIKANTYIAGEMNKIGVTEEELLDYYQLNKGNYQKEIKEYKYQRILIKAEPKFREAVSELQNGVKFKEVAKKYSEEAAGKSGGYMGYVSKGKVDLEIWQVLEELEKYRWKSLSIDGKYCIVRWYEKREARIDKTYSEIKEELKQKYLEEKRSDKYKDIMRSLETGFDIEINYLFNGAMDDEEN